MMHMLPSNEQVRHEKLPSNPIVPSVQMRKTRTKLQSHVTNMGQSRKYL